MADPYFVGRDFEEGDWYWSCAQEGCSADAYGFVERIWAVEHANKHQREVHTPPLHQPEQNLLTGHTISIQPVTRRDWGQLTPQTVWAWSCTCGEPKTLESLPSTIGQATNEAQDHLDTMIPEVPVS